MALVTILKQLQTNAPKERLIEVSGNLISIFSCSPGSEKKDQILDLILALQSQPVIQNIRSCIGDGSLSGDIALLYSRLSSNQVDIQHTILLLELVVAEVEDKEIWNAVLDLITRIKPAPSIRATTTAAATLPNSISVFAFSVWQTPWFFNTGSFANTLQRREHIDDILRVELKIGLKIDVLDLFQTIFWDVPRLDELAEVIFRQCQGGDESLYKKSCGWV